MERCDRSTRGTNMLASGLSPGVGMCTEVLLSSSAFGVVFSLVGCGTGAVLSVYLL